MKLLTPAFMESTIRSMCGWEHVRFIARVQRWRLGLGSHVLVVRFVHVPLLCIMFMRAWV